MQVNKSQNQAKMIQTKEISEPYKILNENTMDTSLPKLQTH